MDDNRLDNLITIGVRSRNSRVMPPAEFFASIATREIMRCRRRRFFRLSAAASVCLLLAAGLWLFHSGDRTMDQPSSAGSYLYSENVDNATERIDRLASEQADLRQSIDQIFPF